MPDMRRFAAPCRLLRVGPVALCALSAHATLYRSVFPEDGVHGYFGWYEPLVAALSAASLLAVVIAAVAALRGHRSRLVAEFTAVSPTPPSACRLAALGVVWLTVQESVERSIAIGGFQLASFTRAGWVIVLVTALLAATVLTMLARAGCALASVLRSISFGTRRSKTATRDARREVRPHVRRRRALADRRGLRAPPTPA
jgi:hypothetical protein